MLDSIQASNRWLPIYSGISHGHSVYVAISLEQSQHPKNRNMVPRISVFGDEFGVRSLQNKSRRRIEISMSLIKRCIISPDEFRISAPSVDVSSANDYDFMLHENFLSAQPYLFTFVACPFAGYVGNDDKQAVVNVETPGVTDDPVVIVFPVAGGSVATWPQPRDQGSGTDQSGYDANNWRVITKVVSSTQVDVLFNKTVDGRKSPAGAYLMLIRKS